MMKLVFLFLVFAHHAWTGPLRRTKKPFTWKCGIDICTLGVHYCDDISEPAVCERCNEDVCNRQFPPSQCIPTCHSTETLTPTRPRPSPADKTTPAPWTIMVWVILGVIIFVLLISLAIVVVRYCRLRNETPTAPAQPTTPPENDTCERAVSASTFM